MGRMPYGLSPNTQDELSFAQRQERAAQMQALLNAQMDAQRQAAYQQRVAEIITAANIDWGALAAEILNSPPIAEVAKDKPATPLLLEYKPVIDGASFYKRDSE